jgi:crotonobetaine/carnitine-CoA ligase
VHRTIPELLDDAASRDPDGVWLRADGLRLSFASAAAWVAAAAVRLGELGVGRGDLVLLTLRNTPEYLVALLAVCSRGAIAVSANPSSSAAELAGLVAQLGPVAAISDDELLPLLATSLRVLTVSSVAAREVPGSNVGLLDIARSLGVGAGDPAVLIPTSGTTGRSKLVTQTHRAYTMAGEGFPHWMELSGEDVLMTSLPLFHINAVAYSTMGSLAAGAGLVLLPRFSASSFLDDARRFGATEFNAIGAMLEILMRQPARPDDAVNPLRVAYTGPTPPRERQEEFEARFGVRLVCGYGLSESPYGTIWARGTRPFGTMGSARQHPTLGVVNDARVVADDGVSDVASGGVGELLLRNPTVTPGYWGMPAETADVIVDGWLHTGDLVVQNADGTFTFVSRKKEVIRRRGENLSPLEVEEAVAAHPAVLECAVVGVPSELSEEEVKAFVVARSSVALDLPALRAFAAERLSAFKVPRYWEQIAALPRTPTNRVAKHRLPAPHGPGEIDMTDKNSRTTQETP